MEFGVLGPLTLRQDAHTTTVVGARRRALLAALLAGRGSTVGFDELVDALWPEDPPPSARHTLHTHVSRLRTELGVHVTAQDGGYRLTGGEARTDADRFDLWVDQAASATDPRAVELLQDALALWRGPAFGDGSGGRHVQGEVRRLTERRLVARELLVDRLVAAGRAPEAVQLWRFVAEALGLEGIELAKGEVAGLHPTRSARLSHVGGPFGALGEIDPGVLDAYGIGERVAYL